MDVTETLLVALRKIAAKAGTGCRSVKASDLREVLASIARDAEQALARHEPTPLEWRAALEQLARAPAVRQALGATHTRECTCPLCHAEELLR